MYINYETLLESAFELPLVALKPPDYSAEHLNIFRARWLTSDILKETIKQGDTLLIDGSWLVRHGGASGVLPRRQELPEGAPIIKVLVQGAQYPFEEYIASG